MKENKKEFVEKYLQPLIKQADSTVEKVEYHSAVSDEIVAIEYKGNRPAFCVSVTCDSLRAVVLDVVTRLWGKY